MKALKTELGWALGAIAFTLAMAAVASVQLVREGGRLGLERPQELLGITVFGVVVALLLYGGLVYQLARIGYYWRMTHRARAGSADEPAASHTNKALVVLVPSYREELKVLGQTVLSAALMDHPHRRIVALLDDPPTGSGVEMQALDDARRLIRGLDLQFAACAGHFSRAHWDFLARARLGEPNLALEAEGVAALYEQAAAWIETQAPEWAGSGSAGHTDRFFAEQVLGRLAAEHRARANLVRSSAPDRGGIEAEYQRLSALFSVRIESFERKRYANLSHAPNKAMNLNAYIGLMGGGYRERQGADGLALEACEIRDATFQAPAADYLLTLDADSIVLPDYARKLVAQMEQDPRIAVAQTPYSAFPDAPGRLERIAGATTDLQYLVHQGSSAFRAAYWVGANALLRRTALADIRQEVEERGHIVPVFIQAHTVIEDTGSTVDLLARGWRVHNHPERLAYSATPPDFGSLIVQRRRWANGGLIILPSLLRYLCGGKTKAARGEGFLRLHYLLSPTLANFGVLLLLAVPFEIQGAGPWLVLAALPYAFVCGRDLKQTGYRWRDLIGVYALNLLLAPVNIAGVLDSVRQLISGRKTPFARTPKIAGRTATPRMFLVVEVLALGGLAASLGFDVAAHRWAHAAMSGVNLGLLAYAFARFIGWRHAVDDLRLAWVTPAAAVFPALEPAMEGPLAAPATANAWRFDRSVEGGGETWGPPRRFGDEQQERQSA
jgi:cellulose synthase/poly-beta-1,6-N-acetylglucosamine synthase-like glycosyltransferase